MLRETRSRDSGQWDARPLSCPTVSSNEDDLAARGAAPRVIQVIAVSSELAGGHVLEVV